MASTCALATVLFAGVAISVLQETNTNVKQILGRDLALAVRVKDKQPQRSVYLKLPSLEKSRVILNNRQDWTS